jgi:D-glycero-D-manno-heptose 1,7-bisphosphate phosphatase
MNKVVFLDRDGVVNVERGEYTWKIEDFALTIGLIDFLKVVIQKGYLVIIISNQGGVGKGLCTIEDVEKAHQHLHDQLKKENLNLTDIYYCPHHPNSGKCLCRKPESIMLEKAIARYDVDITKSVFIGDRPRDVETGQKAGVKTILIESNENLCNYLSEITD